MFPLTQKLVIGYVIFEVGVLLVQLLTAHLLTYPYVASKYKTVGEYLGWSVFRVVMGWATLPLAYIRVALAYALLRWLGWL